MVEAGVHPGNTPFAGDDTATGNVLANDTDADINDTKAVVGVAAGTPSGPLSAGVGTTITGTYGTLQLAANGTWTYTLNNADPDTDALAQGQQAHDVFTYTMADSQGAKSTTTLTVNITGTNDTPVFAVGQPLATSGAVEVVSTGTTGNQYQPSVAPLSTGGYVVTWTDVNGSEYDVHAQIYDSAGNKVGSEFQVNTYSAPARSATSPPLPN